jgi:hypothetical protein
MPHVYLPATSPDDWRRLLAQPDLHWKPGRSAHAMAHAWQAAGSATGGLPAEVRAVMVQFPAFAEIEALAVLPEHQTPLPGGGRASQTDALVVARTPDGLVVLGVEGKAGESFGPTVAEWERDASRGKIQRLEFLRQQLDLETVPGTLRYQLLHRATAALLEAERFFARHAVLLVHSWSPQRVGFADFAAFAALLGVDVAPGALATVPQRSTAGRGDSGVTATLHLAWVDGGPPPPSSPAADPATRPDMDSPDTTDGGGR